MRVICNGYKTCDTPCEHSKPHECHEKLWIDKDNVDDAAYCCNCTNEYLPDVRKEKLKKLNESRL